MKQSKLISMLCLFALAGCSVLPPVKTTPLSEYMVNSVPDNVRVNAKHQSILMVNVPETRPVYNTTRMAYSTQPHKIAYFGQNEWAETPVQMLQPLFIETLQRTNRFQAIVTPPYTGPYDYTLSTHVLQFETDYTRRPAYFKLVTNANLNEAVSGKLLAMQQFRIYVPLVKPTPYAGVLAANEATKRLLKKVAAFTLSATISSPEPKTTTTH